MLILSIAFDEVCNAENHFFDVLMRWRVEVPYFHGHLLRNLVSSSRYCIHESLSVRVNFHRLDQLLLVLVTYCFLFKKFLNLLSLQMSWWILATTFCRFLCISLIRMAPLRSSQDKFFIQIYGVSWVLPNLFAWICRFSPNSGSRCYLISHFAFKSRMMCILSKIGQPQGQSVGWLANLQDLL